MPKDKNAKRLRKVRHIRLRNKVSGTPDRPRLAVFRSLRHIYAQVIDDSRGVTLAAASSTEPEVRSQRDGKPKSQTSKLVGELVAKRAISNGVTAVVFDRGGYKYHGRVKVVADAAREGGLSF